MSEITSVCVYCGSGAGTNPVFAEAAESLGRTLANEKIRLVYGGGSIGLMGIAARSVLACGGEVVGVIPGFLSNRERMLSGVTELIVTEDMHERKRIMFDRADAFVALPGGVGTLEETIEMLTWAQLGRHTKPVLLANIDGFWQPLLGLLSHMRENEFIRPEFELRYEVVDSVEEILPRLRAAAGREIQDTGEEAAPIEKL